MQRVAEVINGSNIVLKNLVRLRKTQLFIFDGVSKTVKSVEFGDRSVAI